MDPDRFLEGFFGPGNGLRWGQIPEEFNAWLQPWIDRVKSGHFPVILPRWTADRSMVWYGGAASSAATSELRELITAFVGPSYAIFSGRLAALEATDPVDQAAAAFFGTSVYKFSVPNRDDAFAIRASLDRLRKLLEVRPSDQRHLARPIGRILRDFDLSLVAGDDKLSQQLIDELRTRGQLNAANLSFLEIVRMVELDDWDGVLAHPNLPRLVEMRRPTRVTVGLVEAMHRRFLAPYEASQDVRGSVAEMRDVVLPRYGPLFDGLPILGPYTIRALLLQCLASDSLPVAASRQLLAAIPAVSDAFIRLLAAELEATIRPERPGTDADITGEAHRLIASGQLQAAMSLLAKAEPSSPRAAMIVHCAYELNTLEAARNAAATVDALAPSEFKVLPDTRQFQQMLAAIRESVGGAEKGQHSPSRWAEWFDRVAADPDCHPYALRWAQAGADEWGSTEFDDGTAVESVIARLGHGQDSAVAIQRDALPYFLRAIGTAPPEVGRRIHGQVLDTLLYRGARSRAELQVILDMLESTVGDLEASTYRRVISDLSDVWSEVQAPSSLEWAIQLLDVLVVQPCRDNDARQALALSIVGTATAHLRRLDLAMRLTLNDVARDLQLPAEAMLPGVAEKGDRDPLSGLRGQRVAVYTLTESAGIRARDRLTEWTQRRVEVLSDRVCTDTLRAAAREVDLFVMVTRSAKHPATDCIKAHRPEGRPLVTTSGKGSSSVIYAVRTFLASIADDSR